MATSYSELIRKVTLGLPGTDGETHLIVRQAINDAHKAIATVMDFDELKVWDKTNCVTVASQQRYHWTSDWGLTRPKDIYSIILHDDSNSRKLTYVPPSDVDNAIPYPEGISTSRSKWYSQFGNYFELYPIPDAVYTLYVRYSQWPVVLSADTDETPFINLDTQIVFLSKDIANAYLSGQYLDFTMKAKEYLLAGISESRSRPDQMLIAKPFRASRVSTLSEYWKDPFIKENP